MVFVSATSAFSVSLWWLSLENSNHRDTENTELAQRISHLLFITSFRGFYSQNVTAHLPEVYDWLAIDLYPLVRLKD